MVCFNRPQVKRKSSAGCSTPDTPTRTSPEVAETSCDTEEATAETIRDLRAQLNAQKQLLQEKEQLIVQLQNQRVERFGIERFGSDDSLFNFYTGFSSFTAYKAFFSFIEPSASRMQTMYYEPSESISLAGRPKCILLVDELFMFLCRLRVNLLEMDLAVRFNCSVSTVSRKLITWANYLYFVLGSIPIWLSRADVDRLMPDAFKTKYPSTRMIIDCTEIRSQHPSSLLVNSQLFSHYKNYTTYKCLIAIAPHGAVTFVSPLYTGNMSDKEITKLCGILDLLEPNDSVMADKGFLVEDLLKEKQCTLNIPPFLRCQGQFSLPDVHLTEEIASLRIHVERFIRRVKENHMFDSEIPLTLMGSINQIWTVAVLLANFKGPLIK
jgi:hypothetical protein